MHITPHQHGLKNVRKAKKVDSITMGNGNEEEASVLADIAGTILDMQGAKIMPATLTDVSVFPKAKYNLFSITQSQKRGGIGRRQWRNEIKVE